MPFESEAQRRWMYANEPEMAKRWQKHTPKGKKLPKKKAAIEKLALLVLADRAQEAYQLAQLMKLSGSPSTGQYAHDQMIAGAVVGNMKAVGRQPNGLPMPKPAVQPAPTVAGAQKPKLPQAGG